MKLLYDIEANGLEELVIDNQPKIPKIIYPATKVFCVVTKDIDTKEVREFGPDAIEEAVDHLNDAELIIAHNGIMFDSPVLSRLVKEVTTPTWDTLVVSKLMFPDIQNHPFKRYICDKPNSLAAWGLHLGLHKIAYDNFEYFTPEMLDYCVGDVDLLGLIFQAQYKSVKNFPRGVIRREMEATRLCAIQKSNGFRWDAEGGAKLESELLIARCEAQDKLQKVFPPTIVEKKTPQYWDCVHINGEFVRAPTKGAADKLRKERFWTPKEVNFVKGPMKTEEVLFNPASRQMIVERLKELHGWKPTLFTSKGNPILNDEVLQSLPFPETDDIIAYLEAEKVLGMVVDYNQRTALSRDGLIHGSVNPQGAVGGRCTHSQPNVSQVPKAERFRKLWGPIRDNDVLVGCDLSGLEVRLLAHYLWPFDDGAYAEIVLNGDIHTHNQHIVGLPTRDHAKTFLYAYIYGAMDPKLGSIIGKGRTEGTRMRRAFENEIPAIGKLNDDLIIQIERRKGVEMLDGRIIPVRKKNAKLNLLLQGNGAILSKEWMILNHPDAKRWKALQVAYVHDELQYSCDKDTAEYFSRVLEKNATTAGENLGTRIRMDAKAHIGANWSETH